MLLQSSLVTVMARCTHSTVTSIEIEHPDKSLSISRPHEHNRYIPAHWNTLSLAPPYFLNYFTY